MPAPAEIPAPIAYIKVVAVKKLVVGFRGWVGPVCREVCTGPPALPSGLPASAIKLVGARLRIIYLEKIRVFKAGLQALNSSAWNNRIGPCSYFVGF